MQGLVFRVSGVRSRGLGFRVWGLLGFREYGFGLRVIQDI